jgi:hypothetical protein
MQAKVYTFQIKRLLGSALAFFVLYPGLLFLCNFIGLPARHGMILTLIYITTSVALMIILVLAASQKVLIENDTLTFRSLLNTEIVEPSDIRRVTFRKMRRREDIIRIRTNNKTYLLSEFYFPFDELSMELEELIRRHNVKSNLGFDRE